MALTGDASPERQVAYRAAGFDDVVGKPATLADLRAALGRAGIAGAAAVAPGSGDG